MTAGHLMIFKIIPRYQAYSQFDYNIHVYSVY